MIASNDGANATSQRLRQGVVTVVTVTSNTDHTYPFQTLLRADETGLHVDLERPTPERRLRKRIR